MTIITKDIEIGGKTLTLETGRIAKQANGSIYATMGGSAVLATACSTNKNRPGAPFFPLSCEYQERFYAAGRIPGSYFRREGRPTEKEILTSRMIDRPARPLFPEGFMADTQVIATVMSYDQVNDSDVVAMAASFAALAISDIPWDGPVGAVRVSRNGEGFIANPTVEERAESDLDLVVAVGPKGVVMVEGEAKFVSESVLVDALLFAQQACQPIITAVRELQQELGTKKVAFVSPEPDAEIVAAAREVAFDKMAAACAIPTKLERYSAVDKVKADAVAALAERFAGREGEVKEAVSNFKSEICREQILSTGKRIDGRATDTVRPITIELGVLPRAHGSVLFTRGETQAIVAITLGTGTDDQRMEYLHGMESRKFMLHYNFPPFSVGEVKMLRGPGRREIGHGNLARRGVEPILPSEDMFPYVLRSVSEITESNGSSSMATVCGTSLGLMDAGVPVSDAVAGIAMGLISDGKRTEVLSDILGDEDHFGDMDFKVVGSAKGVSALQMDIKIDGLDRATMEKALEQARQGRMHILEKMNAAIEKPRDDISPYAPRIFTILIDPDRIRDLIGPGGKHIKGIVAETGAQVNVNDDGRVDVAAVDAEVAQKAIDLVRAYTASAEVGKDYDGKVVRLADFGAFVQIAPGMDGLCHISELAEGRVEKVEDVVKLGDPLKVRVLAVDKQSGKIRLSHREAMGFAPREGGGDRGDRRGGGGRDGGRSRSPRGGDRDGRRSRGPRDDAPQA
ncbi:MAG: polyribonucleotide nucleotidyltransferase [Deltaproteobacteria bacterium]|nr:polyribonucleotide nucleotidyltransferase [Deltaproteobacteria bacterium]